MLSYELKQKWIEAARSGRYRQIKGTWQLRVDGYPQAYCIMGLLGSLGGLAIMGNTAMMQLTGMNFPQIAKLTQLNDKGMSFAELADWIEANVPCKPQELTIP